MKKCPKCGVEKNNGDFYKGKSRCKPCLKVDRLEYTISHREINKEKSRRYHMEHRDECNAISRKRHLEHRNEDIEYGKKYRERIRISNPKLVWAKRTIHSHKYQKKPCLFTAEELVAIIPADNLCPRCRTSFKWNNPKHHDLSLPSLDQIDRDVARTIENSKVICWHCNAAKTSCPPLEYEMWLRRSVAVLDAITRDRKSVV